jgi:hypothetical protein
MGPVGRFDADLFSDVNRWLEVRVDGQALTPRQIIGSVPWALIAQQANEIVPDPNAPFRNCGDGTVADPKTGLRWEKKTNDGSVNDVFNTYSWSTGSPWNPDGTVFTDFLAKLNDPIFGVAATDSDVTGCFAGNCDWRLPTTVELKTIIDCTFGAPCIDPIFGPTRPLYYWSASRHPVPSLVWAAYFDWGTMDNMFMSVNIHVRAVRAGSCN